MVANTDNTICMLITTFQKATRLPRTDLNIVLDNVTLGNVDSKKLLGIIVDKYLTWKHHVDKNAKTISKNIVLFHRIKRYLRDQTCLTFYKNHIQPHLDYCNTIWGLSAHVHRIFTLQKMVLRIIMNVPKLTHSASLFNECKIMTIQNRVKFRTATLVYKSLNGLTPIYMTNMFQKVANVSTRKTRSSPIGFMSQGGISVLVRDHYDTMVLYYIIH